MEKVVYPRDGDPVRLRPCPPWCIEDRYFADDGVIHSDDGYHHYGPEIMVPKSYRMLGLDGPETVVKVFPTSWTHPLDAEPGPALIELQLRTRDKHRHVRRDHARPGQGCRRSPA
jgi:hypothetical protein